MTYYKMGRDINGNKVLRVRPEGGRGFSIQTNGNIPKTDHYGVGNWTHGEVLDCVQKHGSAREKLVMGLSLKPSPNPLTAYRSLHEIVSDCVERGVISMETAPDDHYAIMRSLDACCKVDPEDGGGM